MKSAYYAAAITNAYRHALDAVLAGQPVPQVWVEETEKVSHRAYSTGFYFGAPGQHTADSLYLRSARICAVVESCEPDGEAILTQRNRFRAGELLDLLTNDAPPLPFSADGLRDAANVPIDTAPHPMMRLRLKLPRAVPRLSILRQYTSD